MAEVSSWVIYAPSPNMFAHRAVEWVVKEGQAVESGRSMHGTLDMIRGLLEQCGFAHFDRHPDDNETIVEVWI